MSRALTFRRGTLDLEFGLERIDRKKLYGYVDNEVLDTKGRPCEMALLGGDGRTLVGRGGSAILMLDPDGNLVDKDKLTPVDDDGKPLSRVPSSFAAPIELSTRASVEDLLSHNIKAVYALTPPMGADALVAELQNGTIYTFPFSFRGGLDADAGFLLTSSEGLPFLLLGKPTRLEFVTPNDFSEPELDAEDAEDESDEDMDFAMM